MRKICLQHILSNKKNRENIFSWNKSIGTREKKSKKETIRAEKWKRGENGEERIPQEHSQMPEV